MDQDIPSKLTTYSRAMCVINRILKPKLAQKHTGIKAYKTIARPKLVYGREAWTIRETNKKR